MMREFRFLLKDRAGLLWITLGFIVSSLSVGLGLIEIDNQRAEIAALQAADQTDRQAIMAEQSGWGGAAYYTFHLTADAPSDFAFAALGQRDVSPWKHRVRMLALEGQIYESDVGNPDLALIGRFDFAFVAALLAPLLVILLLFDLRSGERAAGRLNLIEASASGPKTVWRTRTVLRVGALTLALLLPLWIGGLLTGTALSTLALASLAIALYLTFWALIVGWFTSPNWTGSVNLTILVGVWLALCAVWPAALSATISRAVPLPETGDIMLTQREAVNDAWDLPKSATFEPFAERHPEWTTVSAPEEGFDWGWYYAFQQVGDQTVEELSQAYRDGRKTRDELAGWSSYISPTTALQRTLERLANTDTQATLDYEARIRAFHAELRNWYYPRLYEVRDFSMDEAQNDLPTYKIN